jgi:hypothetical protein
MAKDNKNPEIKGQESEEKNVKMIWIHKKLQPGTSEECFGFQGVANEDGFLVMDVPKSKVKNEMLRPKKLIPLDLYNKKKALDEESAKLFE